MSCTYSNFQVGQCHARWGMVVLYLCEFWVMNCHLKWGIGHKTQTSQSVVYIYGSLQPNQVQRKRPTQLNCHSHSLKTRNQPPVPLFYGQLFNKHSKEINSSSFTISAMLLTWRQATWLKQYERDTQQSHWYDIIWPIYLTSTSFM